MISGIRKGQANSRRTPGDPCAQGSSRDNKATLQWQTPRGSQWCDLQSDLHQRPGGKGRSTGTQEVNPGIKLPIMLFCLIRPWAETEWQSPSRQKQEYSGIQGSDPHQCHSEYHSVYWEKGCGAGGTTASCACTKPGANWLLLQYIALVSGKTVLTWHPMGSIQNRSARPSDLGSNRFQQDQHCQQPSDLGQMVFS